MTKRNGHAADIRKIVAMDGDVKERANRLREIITRHVGHRRDVPVLAPKEIARIKGSARHLTLSKSLIPNIIALCRKNKRADTKSAVLVLITLLCDNDRGVCPLTMKRMAELLDRTERNIHHAVNELEAERKIGVNRTAGGLANTYWPIVPAIIAETRPHPVWFIDALSQKPVRGQARVAQSAVANPAADDRVTSCVDTLSQTTGYPVAEQHSISLLSSLALNKTKRNEGKCPVDLVDRSGRTSSGRTSGAPDGAINGHHLTTTPTGSPHDDGEAEHDLDHTPTPISSVNGHAHEAATLVDADGGGRTKRLSGARLQTQQSAHGP
jgi:hypothetical protein